MRFQPSLRGTLHLGRTNAFFLGGGKALMNAYYATAERLGVEVLLRHRGASRSNRRRPRSRGRRSSSGRRAETVRARSAWCWPPAASSRTSNGCARLGRRRATTSSSAARRTTRARCCKTCSTHGARAGRRPDAVPRRGASTRARRSSTAASSRGSTACRSASSSTATASASTTRARTSGPSATRSGAGSSRSSRTDRLLDHRRQVRSASSCRRSFPPIDARTPSAELARALGLDPPTLARHRRAVQRRRARPARSTTPSSDDCHTEGLTPPKTHWARPIDTPPFWATRCAPASPSPTWA